MTHAPGGDAPDVVSVVPVQGSPGGLALPVHEVEAAQAYAVEAHALETRIAYRKDWAGFVRWCAERGNDAEHAQPAAVATYLAWLADHGRALSGVTRVVSGLAHHLRRLDPSNWPRGRWPEVVCTVLRGLRRTVPYVPRRKKPLVAEDLGGS